MTAPAPPSPAPAGERGALVAALLAGALLGSLVVAVLNAALPAFASLATADRAHAADLVLAAREWLAGGGWFLFPCAGAALALLVAGATRSGGARPVPAALLALALFALPFVLKPVWREREETAPRTLAAKMRAVRVWSYRTPATVLRVVALSRDPDPRLREQAVMALGVNLIVTDIEHATGGRPARFVGSPVRDSLRVRLFEALSDPLEIVRAEAARALWNAPVALRGPHPAAAETLAAVLDRAAEPGRAERLAWLALDAAAGAPDSALKSAAARFAAATPDSGLREVARRAARWPAPPGSDKNGAR